MVTESGRMQEFEDLLGRYNRAFYDRDLAALRALYVPDVEVPYFDKPRRRRFHRSRDAPREGRDVLRDR